MTLSYERIGSHSTAFIRQGLPTLIVSGRDDVTGSAENLRRDLITAWRVSTIVSLLGTGETPGISSDVKAIYKSLGIERREVPLVEDDNPPPGAFFDKIGKEYIEHYGRTPTYAFLVHCLRGCNRSGIAMAALLWMTSQPGTWASVEDIVSYMRKASKDFIQKPKYVLALRLWTGELPEPRRGTGWRAGIAARDVILRMQDNGLARALAMLDQPS